MIRINLLGAGPPGPPKPPSPPATALRHFLTLAFSAVVAGGIVYGFYTVWSREVANQEQELGKQQRRQTELRGVQDQNRRYQQQLSQLETRINTIETLKNSKAGPVDFMLALGEVVNRTKDLFLFTVGPEGERLSIKGQSGSVEGMATFLAALKDSDKFSDVQLRQYWEDDQENRVSYKFNLDCVYKGPTTAQSSAPGQPATAAGVPARRAGM